MPSLLSKYKPEDFLGLSIEGYRLEKKIGKGKIGFVFKAVNAIGEIFACKVIPELKLKDGWYNEVKKVRLLEGVPNVIQYKNHGSFHDHNKRPFTWIFWNYVDGSNLRDYVTEHPLQLNLPFVHKIGAVLLDVLYACRIEGIHHGDLHEGNILISKPDRRFRDNKEQIWIADFGLGSTRGEVKPKDDREEICKIILGLLNEIHFESLNAEHRILLARMRVFIQKNIFDYDPTQVNFEKGLAKLIEDFSELPTLARKEIEAQQHGKTMTFPGDYPNAEEMGDDKSKWANLFVPELLGIQDLLRRSITILTGARGCGKTMAFKRLTAYMDKIIGASSGVNGSDSFIGFYINCRSLAEAFPYLPKQISQAVQARYVHYFHLAWFTEVCKTMSVYDVDQIDGYDWLEKWIQKLFSDRYSPLPKGANVLANIQAFIENEKEFTRTKPFKKNDQPNEWALSRYDFLDLLSQLMREHLPWTTNKPFYFFVDDYTIPIISREEQRILNPIIFKRTSSLFFKVSTEAINSVELYSTGKPLELNHDFALIDLASESLDLDDSERLKILSKIFEKRISRDDNLVKAKATLEKLLGNWEFDNNSLAHTMRFENKRVNYYGVEVFSNIWNSDIRNMIQIFVDMLRESYDEIVKKGNLLIKPSIQDRIFRRAGRDFLELTIQAPDPKYLEKKPDLERNVKYGEHLKNIVETFMRIARYELMEANLVKNEDRHHPKQAFKIEVMDHFELREEARPFFEGLIRWHIFLQDRRGKSIRGMFSPRMFLNRMLIPHATITFSKHDHIRLNNQQLDHLLREPLTFFEAYKEKREVHKKRKEDKKGQMKFNFSHNRKK